MIGPDIQPTHLKNFDDNEHIKPSKSFHVERIIIYYSKFICGLDITYKLDGKNKTVEHRGTATHSPCMQDKVLLEEFEHIEFVHCTYSQRGLHSLFFRTNTGRLMNCEGQVGKGSLTRELNLRDHNKALIGFRGLLSSHILDLYMYIALRLDIISEQSDAHPRSARIRISSRTHR